jgi:hypothetical protein
MIPAEVSFEPYWIASLTRIFNVLLKAEMTEIWLGPYGFLIVSWRLYGINQRNDMIPTRQSPP